MAQGIQSGGSEALGGITCPTEGDLLAFAEGALTEPATETIIEHLAQCDQCEMLLARLAENSSLFNRFQASSAADAVIQEAECLRMQVAIRELPNRGMDGRTKPDQESTDKTRHSTDHQPPGRGRPADEVTTAYVHPAQTIGRYQVCSVLGEGGYGQVYLAHDPQLDRQVAIKVAKFGPTVSRRLIDAFLAEAKVLAKLKHPGIVTVYDAGFDPAAGCYIVMEYVEGRSLKQVMKAAKVSHGQAAKYVAQAAEAVHYAHKQGVVHRDLKPANLLVDAVGNIKVADFGLAILEEEQRDHAGEIAGTLLYSSPEQVRGEVHHLDGRTDIWSLGVILYELLAGSRPFRGPNIADEILHRPLKPPRQIDDTIPQELERNCIKCLAKESSGRYLTAMDLAHELCAAGRAEPRVQVRFSMWSVTVAIVVSTILIVAVLTPVLRYWPLAGGSIGNSDPVVAAVNPSESYNVDPVAKPFVPLRLLSHKPRELFPPSGATERWLFDAEREEIWLDTPTVFLIGLGETGLGNYRLHVEISKNELRGEAGLFVGYQPIPPTDGPEQWKMEMICIKGCEDGQLAVNRTTGDVTTSGTSFGLSTHTPTFSIVPPSGLRNCSLDVTVGQNQITEVRWMGVPLPDLVKFQPEVAVVPIRGQFGLIGFHGATWFQNARFEALEHPDHR